jgi:hypothetical protein
LSTETAYTTGWDSDHKALRRQAVEQASGARADPVGRHHLKPQFVGVIALATCSQILPKIDRITVTPRLASSFVAAARSALKTCSTYKHTQDIEIKSRGCALLARCSDWLSCSPGCSPPTSTAT